MAAVLCVEVDDAHRLHVEPHEIVVRRRQHGADAAEREQPLAHAELEDQRQIHHQERREPADLGDEPEQVAATPGGKRAGQTANQAGGIANRIAREEQRGQRAVFQALPQHFLIEGAVHADHAADAEQREAEAERNGAKVFGGDEDDERVAAAAVGHARGDEAEGLQRQLLLERELHHAAHTGPALRRETGSRRR